jgi:2-furoyl-CoA dehydrogenase FAD binding subunit
MKPVAFEYCRPDSIAEAVTLLEEFGPDASVLSGGMSLGPMLNMRLVRPVALVDVKRVPGMDRVVAQGAEIRTGATLRQAAAMRDATLMQSVPLLALALPHVGHFQTRNRGTLGGSVAHADPSSEIPLALATLGGAIELASRRGTRRIAAREFFVDVLTTARESDELLTALLWPARRVNAGHAFDEICQRHGDFAIVAIAAEAVVDANGALAHLALGLGGVESRPMVADTAAFLGRNADAALAREIAAAAADSADPMSDLKATADYRRALVRASGAAVLAAAFADARRP